MDLPWCFYSNDDPASYDLTNLTVNGRQVQARLALNSAAFDQAGPDIENLQLLVEYLGADAVRIQLKDADNERWEVPHSLYPALSGQPAGDAAVGEGARLLDWMHTEQPFSFSVERRPQEEGAAQPAPLFNTTGFRLIYKEQYIELTTAVPAGARVFGLGERTPSSGLVVEATGLPRTLWSRDWGAMYPDTNLYGAHPLYLQLNPDGSAHGAVMLNSNAMDVVLSGGRLSFRLTGGIVDLLVLAGPSPMSVMEQLTRLLGRPAPQPFWALGFHQCRWGYKDIDALRSVVAGYRKANIPLEVMWSDIDAMDQYRIFTLDPVNYAADKMREFVAELHAAGQKWVPIVDPGVKIDPGYPVYEDGLAQDVFLKDITGKPYIGFVWPGAVHYPDFLNSKAHDFWAQQIAKFHELIEFDGLWIDMNEASNFCTGEICTLPQGAASNSFAYNYTSHSAASNDCPLKCVQREQLQSLAAAAAGAAAAGGSRDALGLASLPEAQALIEVLNRSMGDAELQQLLAGVGGLRDPPYRVANSNVRAPLGAKAIGVTVSHHGGELQYDAHSLYGLTESIATHNALLNVTGRRPFVLTRSSYLGTGAYSAHWTGDNGVTWDDLYWSVLGVMNSGLFGMPMAGSDICGFAGTPNPELCARWISLGAFYPFSRNHHSVGSGNQELYRWPEVAASGRRALSLRYALLATLYTFMRAAALRGCPMFRPMWMNYPTDDTAQTVDRQFMLGDSILVTPVLESGADSVVGYFPPGVWYSLWDDAPLRSPGNGSWVTLPAPVGEIPVHVAGGHVLAMQAPQMTTRAVRASPLMLVAALPTAPGGQQEAGEGGSTPRRDERTKGTAGCASGQVCMAPELPPLCWSGQQQEGPGASNGTRVQVACGQVYMDAGDEPQLGGDPENLLTVTATLTTAEDGVHQTGVLLALYGAHGRYAGAGGGGGQACGAQGVKWPGLHAVSVLGVPPGVVVNATLEQVLPMAGNPGDGAGVPGVEVTSSVALTSAQAVYNSHRLELRFPSLNLRLGCPYGLRLTWHALLVGSCGGAGAGCTGAAEV